jgi:hypothetical protein
MVEAHAQKDLKLLTPNIQLKYEDFTQIKKAGKEENFGYFVYQAKSRINGEVHHVRAFNLNAPKAQQNIDKAMTVFLQETLSLCQLYPSLFFLDTLEICENKICYATRPISSGVVKSKIPRVIRALKLEQSLEQKEEQYQEKVMGIFRLLEGLIVDLKYLSNHGNVHPSAERISKITEGNLSPRYFMQDWNQILWETSIDMENLPENQETSSHAREKENIYHLALSILEIGGLKKLDLKNLLPISKDLYADFYRSVLEKPEVGVLGLNSETKDLLVAMLDQEANNRPNGEQILQRIREIEAKIKDSKVKRMNQKVFWLHA